VRVRAVLTIAVLALALAPAATAARSSGGIVQVHDLGTGAAETWVLLPSAPPRCIVTFVHAAGDITLDRYLPWLNYLALDKKCAVIFPRYQATAVDPTVAAKLRSVRASIATGLALVRGSTYGLSARPVAADVPLVVAGVGSGAVLAVDVAADAQGWGLPVPVAVDGVFPTVGTSADLPKTSLSAATRVLVEVGDRDTAGGRPGGHFLWTWVSAHASGKKRFIVVHSTKALTADSNAPLETSAAAELTFWPKLDAMIDSAGG
jgi:hypothetical protein